MYACGCIYGCTPVNEHLEIVCIKVLVWYHDAGTVENLMHQYANYSSNSKSQLMVFLFSKIKSKVKL